VTLSDELALSRHAHDRLGNQRVDEDWIAARWADPDTRVMLLHKNAVAVDESGRAPVYVSPQEAGDGDPVLLGLEGGTTYFALLRPEPPEGLHMATLREFGVALADRDAGLATHAVAMANWHRVYRHCPRCAGALRSEQAGHVRRCQDCGRQQFPRTDPAVIMVVTSGEPGSDQERCLLGRQSIWPEGRFSTLAGFCEPGETLEDAVRREVAEEVGIVVGDVEYFGNQPWPLPASLMLGFVARAVTPEVTVDRDEIEDARWFTRAEMRELAEAGTLVLPGGVSISRSLVEHWYGGPLPGSW
jgi:NAD+ diphosphatase